MAIPGRNHDLCHTALFKLQSSAKFFRVIPHCALLFLCTTVFDRQKTPTVYSKKHSKHSEA